MLAGVIVLASFAGVYSQGSGSIFLEDLFSIGLPQKMSYYAAANTTSLPVMTTRRADAVHAPLATAISFTPVQHTATDTLGQAPQGGLAIHASSSQYTLDDATIEPHASAVSYLIGDVESGEIIAARYSGYELPIASISKLMTALTTFDLLTLTMPVRVSRRAATTYRDDTGGLAANEALPVSELLYPLLLESSNDAAEALAEAANPAAQQPGLNPPLGLDLQDLQSGRSAFIEHMNATAHEIGMAHTAFEDPSGLSSGNVSTAEDLFTLTRFIVRERPVIFEISRAPARSYRTHRWHNISKFLGFSSYRGGKVGYTDEAGKTIVTLWDLGMGAGGHREIAIILLDSQNNQKDIASLLEYLRKNVHYGGNSLLL